MMKDFQLNDEDMQLLKTSLLAFVKRIAYRGTDSEKEAGAFFPIVNLLLGIPVALELNLDDLSEEHGETAKLEELQESENNGICRVHEDRHVMEWRRRYGLL